MVDTLEVCFQLEFVREEAKYSCEKDCDEVFEASNIAEDNKQS